MLTDHKRSTFNDQVKSAKEGAGTSMFYEFLRNRAVGELAHP